MSKIREMFNLQFFAANQGQIKTTHFDDQGRLLLDCSKEIANLYPEVDPFIAIMLQARKTPVDSLKFEWYDEEPLSWWTAINNGSGYLSSATSIVLDDASALTAGSVIKIPRTGEEIRIGAVDTATNTISQLIRGYGATSAAAINDNDQVMFVGNAMEEGYTTPTAVSGAPGEFYNYVQTFNRPVNISNQAKKIALKTGNNTELNRMRNQALFQQRAEMDRVAVFGERYHDTTNKVYKTGGLVSFINTNVFDLNNGDLTELDFDDITEQTFRSGSTTKLGLLSGKMYNKINRWGKDKIVMNTGEKVYGMSLARLDTGHGTLLLAKARQFENYYAGFGMIVDMKNVNVRTFTDTHLATDIGAKTVHGQQDEYETELGFEWRLEKTHAVIKNMKTT